MYPKLNKDCFDIAKDELDEDKMYGAYLSGPGAGKLEYGVLDRPKPKKGQVLIRVESVPINPSDL